MEARIIVNQKFTYLIYCWQDRWGYPGSIMMYKLVGKNYYGYILKSQKILQSSNFWITSS